ncbi:hypothetical protein PFISCL1PPCAC_28707, partial [Pristionchus fissidentatus]
NSMPTIRQVSKSWLSIVREFSKPKYLPAMMRLEFNQFDETGLWDICVQAHKDDLIRFEGLRDIFLEGHAHKKKRGNIVRILFEDLE